MFNILKMKSRAFVILMTILVVSAVCVAAADGVFDPNHTTFEGVLKESVKDGLVNYVKLKDNSKTLDRYLADLAKVEKREFKSWDEDDQLAYLINLYNAATLKMIVNHYPLKSIKDIGHFIKGPWDQPIVKLFRATITLKTLEHKILRKDFDEPRIHMAMVCAAMGCPPLRNEAYTGKKLNAQLDDQTKVFLIDPLKFKIDRRGNTVYLSPIFKWFAKDFLKTYGSGSSFAVYKGEQAAVLRFIVKHLKEDDAKWLENEKRRKIKYLKYDWSLNEQHLKTKR